MKAQQEKKSEEPIFTYYKNTINNDLFRGLLCPPTVMRRLDQKYINDVLFVYIINERNDFVWVRQEALVEITEEEYYNAKQH